MKVRFSLNCGRNILHRDADIPFVPALETMIVVGRSAGGEGDQVILDVAGVTLNLEDNVIHVFLETDDEEPLPADLEADLNAAGWA